jgi:hypothetical protein
MTTPVISAAAMLLAEQDEPKPWMPARVMNNLAFFRRPAISLGAGTAHQHCPLIVTQAFSL